MAGVSSENVRKLDSVRKGSEAEGLADIVMSSWDATGASSLVVDAFVECLQALFVREVTR